MDQTRDDNIKLVVNDEQTLYNAFSPEDEFSEPVKSYIKSKIASADRCRSFNMTVLSREPIDEERFRSAVSNWTHEKKTIRTLIGMLIFGSIMLVLTLSLQKQIVELKYSLMPIMGTLALNNAVTIIIKDMPDISVKKWILNEMEKHNVITFEYGNE